MNIIAKQLEVEKAKFTEIVQRKPNKCVVEFEGNAYNVYYSGQIISGVVKLTLNKKTKSSGVFVKIFGKAYVCWKESDNQSNTEYSGHEIFFEKRVEVTHEGNDTIQLTTPGSYQYTFQYQLPDNLPSSIEYKCGYIRYKASAVLGYKEFEKPFTVIAVSKLSPYMLEPVTTQNYKTFNLTCYLCCLSSDPLETVAEIPRCGYLPHETIDLHLYVNNKSNQRVEEFTVLLIQKIRYFTHKKSSTTKVDKIVLKREYVQGCEAGEQKEFDLNILVPTVPPNQDTCCNIIKLKYFIRILVSVPCCHSDPELYLPINIGSSSVQEYPNLPAWINPIANDFP